MSDSTLVDKESISRLDGFSNAAVDRAPLRVILLGAGRMARHHASAVARLEGRDRVVGVVDPSTEALTEMSSTVPDAVLADSLPRLLSEVEADVVHVCTPPGQHLASAQEAVEAGLHVYVEKPFALSESDARWLLDLASANAVRICAGHQLLFEKPARRAGELLPALGRIVHVESYFSFRPARGGDGSSGLAPDEQLIDILPHPVYLLVELLHKAGADDVHLRDLVVGPGGTVHALAHGGDVAGTLTVTLEGRPIESFLRIVGTNGSITADFVRGTVKRWIGPGTSGIDKILNPYREAVQLVGGTTRALGGRFIKRQRSYPGLAEIFDAFYGSIRDGSDPPVSRRQILQTTAICEHITGALATKVTDKRTLHAAAQSLPDAGIVLVTGGTGFLGAAVVEALRGMGRNVRALSRRKPAPWERVPGVDFVTADLAEGLDRELLEGVVAIIHCAAETSGGWEAHERNSVRATEHAILAAVEAGVERFVHVSSIAVLAGSGPLSEDSPLETGRTAGPYVWGKAESERLAVNMGTELGLLVRVVRPGAIVDWGNFEPPGRLGRRVGNVFVAVGSRRGSLGAVDVRDVARLLAWMALDHENAPKVLNIIDPEEPSKRELIRRLRDSNPDLWVVWLPRFLLLPMSWFATLIQKLLRPGNPPVNIAEVFGERTYDTEAVTRVWPAAREHRAADD